MKIEGLSQSEVDSRIHEGKVNISPKPLVKTNTQICIEHIFNLFNAYNFAIAIALLLVKAYTSMFFVVIVSSNTILRISQEMKSRNMVAKLTLIVSPQTKVLRDNQIQIINNEEIVLDDVIYLETGQQISADAIVLDTDVEVDESLLTGEADPVLKHVGDHLYSGSFIISGACYAKVEHVGYDNYATHIVSEAQNRKPVESVLIQTFNKVTKWTSCLVIPISICMVFQALVIRHNTIELTIINTSAALLGMLPIGLALLTSVSMAASVVRLGEKDVLVQEMFAIETLSHVDILCLDKTGTLTKGKMKVDKVIELDHHLSYQLNDLMNSFVAGSLDNNATFQTIQQYFNDEPIYETTRRVSFSSARKWSALELKDVGTIIFGAPEFIQNNYVLPDAVENAKQSGARILMVAYHADFDTFQQDMNHCIPLAFIIILDPLRDDAKEAIAFFQENDVEVKVISGDNPITVSVLGKQAGIKDSEHYIDASMLHTFQELEDAIMHYNIIGRATPKQKREMILILQSHDQKVAMTGDGVNDVLALKDADVSIAMGSGSDAAKQISQFVFINGALSTMKDVIYEARLDINNVTRSASMYYLKTIYTILISIASICLNIPYPFIPFQMTLLDNFVEGFPSFMILFERNITKQKESILKHAMRYSLPNALVISLGIVILSLIASPLSLNRNEVYTILYLSTAFISIHMIYRIYYPLNWYRGLVLIIDIIGLSLVTLFFWNWLSLAYMSIILIQYTIIFIISEWILSEVVTKIVYYYLDKNIIR